ncbi:hypothetical protein EYF80_042831 [Liparis tanakae]|uniref:Uncharacterized protein n=1 Tax=Liparis tanakae TaxID=230148 RepID=A0A4Z2G367_9TELE|nr:hypothetical protein EYF80_042831 [Liparis tanakae]
MPSCQQRSPDDFPQSVSRRHRWHIRDHEEFILWVHLIPTFTQIHPTRNQPADGLTLTRAEPVNRGSRVPPGLREETVRREFTERSVQLIPTPAKSPVEEREPSRALPVT